MIVLHLSPLTSHLSPPQGWLGNKGAVAVHVDVGGSASLCFVCVHMASHRENLEVRNAEYKQIVSRPVFFEAAGGGR